MKTALLTSIFMIQSLLFSSNSGYYLARKSSIVTKSLVISPKNLGSFSLGTVSLQAQNCNNINWVSWNSFKRRSAEGTVNSKAGDIKVTLSTNFSFTSSPKIFEYNAHFASYPRAVPNAAVPEMSWNDGAGVTKVCFSRPVKDPVLLIASLGNASVRATLKFSEPYRIDHIGSGMRFDDDKSVTGVEGFAVLKFKGEFTCITIYSSVYEYFSNITFGISQCTDVEPVVPPPPPPPLSLPKVVTVPKPAPKPVVPPPPQPSKAVTVPAPVPKPQPVPKPLVAEPRPIFQPVKEVAKVVSPPVKPVKNKPPDKNRLKIQIWDTDCMDFDTVSIKFNGRQIGPKTIPIQLYKRDALEFTYSLDLNDGDNTLEIYAISEGVKPLVSIGILVMYDDNHKKVFYTLKAKETKVIHL